MQLNLTLASLHWPPSGWALESFPLLTLLWTPLWPSALLHCIFIALRSTDATGSKLHCTKTLENKGNFPSDVYRLCQVWYPA